MSIRKVNAIVLAALMCVNFFGACSVTMETEDVPAEETQVQEVRFEFGPEQDYYGYVNGQRISEMEIEFREGEAGSFYDAMDLVDDRVEGIIDEVSNSNAAYEDNSGEAIIRAAFDQYTNYDYVNPGELTAPLFDEAYNRIEDVSCIDEYVELMGEFYHDYGVSLLIQPSVTQNIVFNPDEYCVMFGFESNPLGEELKSYSTSYELDAPERGRTILRYWGVEEEEAGNRIDNLIAMFVDISRNTDFEMLEQDYATQVASVEVYGFDEMNSMLSNIDIESYLTACGAEVMPEDIAISDSNQLITFNEYMTDENLQALKDYAKIAFMVQFDSYLPSSDDALRNMVTTDPSSETAIHDYAINIINRNFADIIGDLYTARYGDEATVEAVEAMCEEIREAYRDVITNASWISDEGRRLLLNKLESIVFKVGARTPQGTYPEYAGVIGNNPMETEINIGRINAAAAMANIGQSYDRMTYDMSATTVNACFNTDNTVTIPYGIINSPFFDVNATRATNLGGLGTVIAHEVSHGFDSNLIYWNAEGIFDATWIPQEDLDNLQVLMDATVEYYSNYTVMDVYHVDGELTLGENFADLGGVQCVLSLVNTPEEYREVFNSYATIWCAVITNESALSSLSFDTHSPDYIRVNAVVSSCDEFYVAYEVEEGDSMYVAPENRINRW